MRKFNLITLFLLLSALSVSLYAQGAMPGAIPARSKGPTDAPVTLEVFNDYACPACASFNEVLKAVIIKFPNELKVIYRHCPLKAEGHEKAKLAARAVEAAGMQNKFWEMADIVLENQGKWRTEKTAADTFVRYAKKLELDVEKFKEDIEGEVVRQRIISDVERAISLNLESTPTVILNGKSLLYSDFIQQKILEELIKENIKSQK
ncbi:MAG TPA: thioredoxin domain-containing protein [Pyrinomonadaceae bacterium]|jgi:protein-disulfide isomerase|nr:thioredoxin domain-containing protein [Pyrinomonadaceae bacterium]